MRIICLRMDEQMLWFARSDAECPSKNFIIKKVFPLSMAEGTKVREGANYSLITIENAFINQNRMEGGFTTEKGTIVAWDLHFDHFVPTYNPLPKIASILNLTPNFWYPIHPNLQISGSISINGEKISFDKSPGHQTHTYGFQYSQEFGWAHCNCFTDCPDAYFDMATRDGRTSVGFFDGKTKFFFNTISATRKIQAHRGLDKLTLSGQINNLEILAEINVPKNQLIGVEYLGPNNTKLYCYNTEVANLIVILRLKGKNNQIGEQKFEAYENCAFENQLVIASRVDDLFTMGKGRIITKNR